MGCIMLKKKIDHKANVVSNFWIVCWGCDHDARKVINTYWKKLKLPKGTMFTGGTITTLTQYPLDYLFGLLIGSEEWISTKMEDDNKK